MKTFDELEITLTAGRFRYLSNQYRETAMSISDYFRHSGKIPNETEARWMDFLMRYSDTLADYSKEAEAIFNEEYEY